MSSLNARLASLGGDRERTVLLLREQIVLQELGMPAHLSSVPIQFPELVRLR